EMQDRCTATSAVPASSAGAGTSSATASPRRMRTCFIVEPRLSFVGVTSNRGGRRVTEFGIQNLELGICDRIPNSEFRIPDSSGALCAPAVALDVVMAVFAAVVLRIVVGVVGEIDAVEHSANHVSVGVHQ